MNSKREFILQELMVEDFAEWEGQLIRLEETEDSGRSILDFRLMSDNNLSIKNVDSKNTQLFFLKKDKEKSLFKRVDHIIYENIGNNYWNLHLIEMKSSVGNDKWLEIKGKFRASYLLAQGIASMLEMHLADTYMYTTYEKVHFSLSKTMPSARRLPLGKKLIKPQDEWESNDFGLNFGERILFVHRPIKMKRSDNRLMGSVTIHT